MVAVCDRLNDFPPDTAIVVATFTTPENLATYAVNLPIDRVVVGTDPTRDAYGAYGFGRGSIVRVWGLRAARRYVALMARGAGRFRRPIEDSLQLGGDVVIDPAGRLSWAHWGDGPDDRPPVDDLIDAAFRARSTPPPPTDPEA